VATFLKLLPLFALTAFLSGCASDDEIQTRSERPWNAPKSWETGLPSGFTEGR